MISVALGDALGAPVEKLSYDEIKKSYERVESLRTEWYKAGLGEDVTLGKRRGHGIVTDDTLMTNALVNVYLRLRRHLDAYDMSKDFVKEIAFKKTYIPELDKETFLIDRLFYPEKYIYIRHVLANCEPREGGLGNMVNCGAAMYMAPVGIVNAGDARSAYNEAILFASGHQCSYGLEAAGVFAACVAKALEPGATIEEIVKTAILHAKDGTKEAIKDLTRAAIELRTKKAEMDEVIHVLHSAISTYSPMKNDVHRHIQKVGVASNHYTPNRLFSIEELPLALAFIVFNDGDYYQSLYDGINSGRDTDSIGVMIGAILGAMYGDKVIKAEDILILENHNRMDFSKIATDFTNLAEEMMIKDILLHEKRRTIL
ncbi:ADP-ribosylglycohydrolase [Bacillus sp. cl95]|nr:ADP-ribosylglycohydrolase [Bacillus sp. UNCCL13]SFQ83919.1 ADP-ribosylglycohydrolase [Bacillus sp. cl95]